MEEKKEEVVVPETALPVEEDAEAKFARLEAEKAKAIEVAANYKMALLKRESKHQDEDLEEEDEEAKMERVARKVMATSQVAQIAIEQDALIKAVLKENKELKLVSKNKTTAAPAAAIGTHSESTPVADTLVTNDQLLAFKARGWTDKDIEKYKKNLQRYGGR